MKASAAFFPRSSGRSRAPVPVEMSCSVVENGLKTRLRFAEHPRNFRGVNVFSDNAGGEFPPVFTGLLIRFSNK
jgi:hypothetical protein